MMIPVVLGTGARLLIDPTTTHERCLVARTIEMMYKAECSSLLVTREQNRGHSHRKKFLTSKFEYSWSVVILKIGYFILYQSLHSFIPRLNDCIICLRKSTRVNVSNASQA